MTVAIEDADLVVERYNQIARSIHEGGEVRRQFEELLLARLQARSEVPQGG